jgi:hypothetical protein
MPNNSVNSIVKKIAVKKRFIDVLKGLLGLNHWVVSRSDFASSRLLSFPVYNIIPL